MTMPAQIDVVRRHVDDALGRGGRAVVGGRRVGAASRYVEPVVLVDVPEDSIAVTEETFGPTLVVNRVPRRRRGRRAGPTPPATASAPPCSRKSRGEEIAGAAALRHGVGQLR